MYPNLWLHPRLVRQQYIPSLELQIRVFGWINSCTWIVVQSYTAVSYGRRSRPVALHVVRLV